MKISIDHIKKDPDDDKSFYAVADLQVDDVGRCRNHNVLRNLLTGPETLSKVTGDHDVGIRNIDTSQNSQYISGSLTRTGVNGSFLRNLLTESTSVLQKSPVKEERVISRQIETSESEQDDYVTNWGYVVAQHSANISFSNGVSRSKGGSVLRNMLTRDNTQGISVSSIKTKPEYRYSELLMGSVNAVNSKSNQSYEEGSADKVTNTHLIDRECGTILKHLLRGSDHLSLHRPDLAHGKGSDPVSGEQDHNFLYHQLRTTSHQTKYGQHNQLDGCISRLPALKNYIDRCSLENETDASLENTVVDINEDDRRKAHKKIFRCDVCHKSYGHSNSLNVHYRIHTGERPFKCGICDRDFSHSNSLKIHMKTHEGKPVFKCEVCEKEFSRVHRLTRHMLVHSGDKPFECGMCGKSFTQAGNLKAHIRKHTGERPFKCEFCDKEFTVSGKLKIHIRVHTGDKPYTCNVCNKKFSTSGGLHIHTSIHTGIKPYSCKICGKGFSVSNDLTKHNRVHTGERPYMCSVCDKRFGQSSSLQKHLRTHSGEKPHKCDICGKGFSQTTHVMRHMRTHTGDKPFSCNICGKTFSFAGNRSKHMRTHSKEKPFKCEICKKGFRDPSYVKTHMMVHTGHRPYPCKLCPKRFMQTCDLNAHMRTHTGSKPYACEYCGKVFRQSGHLQRHVVLHLDGKLPMDQQNCGNNDAEPFVDDVGMNMGNVEFYDALEEGNTNEKITITKNTACDSIGRVEENLSNISKEGGELYFENNSAEETCDDSQNTIKDYNGEDEGRELGNMSEERKESDKMNNQKGDIEEDYENIC